MCAMRVEGSCFAGRTTSPSPSNGESPFFTKQSTRCWDSTAIASSLSMLAITGFAAPFDASSSFKVRTSAPDRIKLNEVETSDVHAGHDETANGYRRAARWTEGDDDFGAAHGLSDFRNDRNRRAVAWHDSRSAAGPVSVYYQHVSIGYSEVA